MVPPDKQSKQGQCELLYENGAHRWQDDIFLHI